MSFTLVDLGFRFRSIQALSKINCAVPSNGVIAFIGPNGAGKSTLLDILSGFLAPTDGVVMDDHGNKLTPANLAARFARLHQRLVLPDLTIAQFLRVAQSPRNTNWLTCSHSRVYGSDAMGTAKRGRLVPFLLSAGVRIGDETPLHALSHGQKRAVAIAATMLALKGDLLLDEPFAGFAHGVRVALQELLSVEKQSRLILVCEHDLDSVIKIAEQCFVLVAGKLVASYMPTQLNLQTILGHFTATDDL